MTTQHPGSAPPDRSWPLGFGMLGGAVAWTVHLIVAALVAEWGCLGGWGHYQAAGINLVAWIILAVSLVMLVVAALATGVAWRLAHQLRDQPGNAEFLASTGAKTSGLFVFIIAAQSLPIAFYLSTCW